MNKPKAIVIGAGLAGLACAGRLQQGGIEVEILEASNRIGGRVGTDYVDGFQLDHGFQVLQTGYSAARDHFDYAALNLKAFDPGALIQTESGRYAMVDPWRMPSKTLQTLFNPIGTLADRWRLARLRKDAIRQALHESDSSDTSVHELLQRHYQFSTDFVDRFLRPWISGMFFDEQLETSSQFFKYIFATLAKAEAALPSAGMQSLPRQLASHLPTRALRLNSPVRRVHLEQVEMEDGSHREADYIVVATDGQTAQALVASEHANNLKPRFAGTLTLYFATPEPPPVGRALLLNGELQSGHAIGPISNVTVPSNVASAYAPAGQSLVCVSVRPSLAKSDGSFNLSTILPEVTKQATRWFGSSVEKWRLIKHYAIAKAVPRLLPGAWSRASKTSNQSRIAICGDFTTSPSLQGALESGRHAAESILHACGNAQGASLCLSQ